MLSSTMFTHFCGSRFIRRDDEYFCFSDFRKGMLPFCYRALGRGRMAVFQDVADANRRGKVDECFRVYACFSWQARVKDVRGSATECATLCRQKDWCKIEAAKLGQIRTTSFT